MPEPNPWGKPAPATAVPPAGFSSHAAESNPWGKPVQGAPQEAPAPPAGPFSWAAGASSAGDKPSARSASCRVFWACFRAQSHGACLRRQPLQGHLGMRQSLAPGECLHQQPRSGHLGVRQKPLPGGILTPQRRLRLTHLQEPPVHPCPSSLANPAGPSRISGRRILSAVWQGEAGNHRRRACRPLPRCHRARLRPRHALPGTSSGVGGLQRMRLMGVSARVRVTLLACPSCIWSYRWIPIRHPDMQRQTWAPKMSGKHDPKQLGLSVGGAKAQQNTDPNLPAKGPIKLSRADEEQRRQATLAGVERLRQRANEKHTTGEYHTGCCALPRGGWQVETSHCCTSL